VSPLQKANMLFCSRDFETCGWAKGTECMLKKEPANCDHCNRFDHHYVKRLKLKENMNHPLRVYLAGGFHTEWQEQVKAACEEKAPGRFIFYNPKEGWEDSVRMSEEDKEIRDKEYKTSPWWPLDRYAIEHSDIIFFNIEDYRPKLLGTGDIFEAGMCYAWSKLVIYVNQIQHRYYRGIARNFPNNFERLEDGIACLLRAAWLSPKE